MKSDLIPDLGDLAIAHAIFSVNKHYKLFYTIHYDILYCSTLQNMQQFNILNITKTIAL
jgi:hypothetical protein